MVVLTAQGWVVHTRLLYRILISSKDREKLVGVVFCILSDEDTHHHYVPRRAKARRLNVLCVREDSKMVANFIGAHGFARGEGFARNGLIKVNAEDFAS